VEREQAEEIVETVQAAWDWVMESVTFDIWVKAIAELDDFETCEFVTIELAKYQPARPRIATVIESYKRQRDLDRKARPTWLLAGPPIPGMPTSSSDAWSSEGARWAMGFRLEDEVTIERNRRKHLIDWHGEQLGAKQHEETWQKIRDLLVSREHAAECEDEARANWLGLGETNIARSQVVRLKLREAVEAMS
jgi:hypothetical protein